MTRAYPRAPIALHLHRLVFHVDGHEHESSGRWPSVHTVWKDEERWVGWNRPVDSFLIRDEAGRSTDLSNSSWRRYDYWSLWRKREGGGRREKENEKENRMGCRGGKDEGQALVGDVQMSSSRKVSSRAKISHFDVSQFYLILQRVGGSIAGDFSLISSWEIIHRMLVISFKLLRLFTGMGYSMENLNIRMSRIC